MKRMFLRLQTGPGGSEALVATLYSLAEVLLMLVVDCIEMRLLLLQRSVAHRTG